MSYRLILFFCAIMNVICSVYNIAVVLFSFLPAHLKRMNRKRNENPPSKEDLR